MTTIDRSEFHYDIETGKLYRYCKSTYNTTMREVGTKLSLGYLKFNYHGKTRLVHRFIWYLCFGYFPTELDHIDRDKTNNRIKNLRECTRSQNMHHIISSVVPKSGFRGVTMNGNGWKAQVYKNGKRLYFGTFATPREAAIAYNKGVKLAFKEFAVLNDIDDPEQTFLLAHGII